MAGARGLVRAGQGRCLDASPHGSRMPFLCCERGCLPLVSLCFKPRGKPLVALGHVLRLQALRHRPRIAHVQRCRARAGLGRVGVAAAVDRLRRRSRRLRRPAQHPLDVGARTGGGAGTGLRVTGRAGHCGVEACRAGAQQRRGSQRGHGGSAFRPCPDGWRCRFAHGALHACGGRGWKWGRFGCRLDRHSAGSCVPAAAGPAGLAG